MGEGEMDEVAALIAQVLRAPEDPAAQERVRQEVRDLTARFPLYPELA
jgi:glycine/serine hydroxymethyltransferase